MTKEHTAYFAEKFLVDTRHLAVDKRLAFDAWADRQGFDAPAKRRLWREVKSISRK